MSSAAVSKPVLATGSEQVKWRTLLRAMSQTGGASVLSGFFTMGATKVIAVMAGPAAVALLATLQQLRNGGVTLATLNGQAAVVQGVSSTDGADRREFLRTSALSMALAGLLAAGALVAMPGAIAGIAGLGENRAGLVRWLALPVVLSSFYVLLTAVLNAAGAIATLAKLQLASPFALLLLSYPLARGVAGGHEGLFIGLLTASAGSAVLFGGAAVWRRRAQLMAWWCGSGGWWRREHATRFVAISGSMVVSGLVATGSLLLLRARILEDDGMAAGGLFDAAWAISMNHVTLLLASLQTYYLPLMARTADPAERQQHTARVLTVAALASAVVIAGLAALKPVAISTLYSDSFLGATKLLRWTLLGDYLKVGSWVLSIPLVAMADMRTFLAADLSAYLAFLGGAYLFSNWLDAAEAVAAAFLLMYAVHLVFCGTCLWAKGEFRPTSMAALAWTGGLALVVASSAWFWDAASLPF